MERKWKKNFFLFIGCKSTMWPAKNYLLIMVFSWAMSSYCIWLHIIFCSCINETTLFSFLQLLLREKWHIASLMAIFIKKLIWWLNGKTILLLNSVIAKYRDLSVCRISIIHFILWPSSFLLTTSDKSWYFVQPHPWIVKSYNSIETFPSSTVIYQCHRYSSYVTLSISLIKDKWEKGFNEWFFKMTTLNLDIKVV